MNSKQKYLKYKMKYLHLKSLVGGNDHVFYIYQPKGVQSSTEGEEETFYKEKTVDSPLPICIESPTFFDQGYFIPDRGVQMGVGDYGIVQQLTLTDKGKRFFQKYSKKEIKQVAVKEIEITPENEDVIRKEIEILTRLKSDYVVEYYMCVFDKSNNKVFLFMELIEGNTLSSFFELYSTEFKLYSTEDIKYKKILMYNTLIQLVLGLKYIHSQNIIHGDINPGNIMMDYKSRKIKYIDFGLSCFTKSCSANFSKEIDLSKLEHIIQQLFPLLKIKMDTQLQGIAIANIMKINEISFEYIDKVLKLIFDIGSEKELDKKEKLKRYTPILLKINRIIETIERRARAAESRRTQTDS
jgi:serine/threonine protein kinase